MNDARTVRCGERVGDLASCGECLSDRKLATPEPRSERLALEELHDDVVDFVLAPDVEQPADVRMCQRGCRLRLALEAQPSLGTADEVRRET